MINRIYPYPVPDEADPWAGLLINAGNRIRLDAEGLNILAQHLREVGFIHNGDQETRHHIILDVGTGAEDATHEVAPGDIVTIDIPDHDRSCVWIDGDAPSALTIEDGKVTGRCAILGVWRFDIVVGPRIKYDSPLAGAPLEPGQWIPVTQRRQVQAPSPEVDLQGLTPDQLDQLISQAKAAKENQ
ncbi:hypothetical protein [Ancrocorticia populi]|uniref:hypothetical protein n=1 Tax=Ancrocorticia populi TaxID=2175228 RepID=UPI003F952170